MQKGLMHLLFITFLAASVLSCNNQKNCAACQRLSTGTFCGKCYNTFYNRSIKRCEVPNHPISNCVEYSETDASVCRRCEFGFGLNALNQCEKCKVNDCARCDDNADLCQSCYKGNLPSENACPESPKARCADPLCDICDLSGSLCFSCSNGNSLNKQLKCDKGIEGCQLLADGNSRCILCHYDYFINDEGICIKNADHKEGLFSNLFFWLTLCTILAICALVYINFFRKKNIDDEPLLQSNSARNTEIHI